MELPVLVRFASWLRPLQPPGLGKIGGEAALAAAGRSGNQIGVGEAAALMSAAQVFQCTGASESHAYIFEFRFSNFDCFPIANAESRLVSEFQISFSISSGD